MNRLLLIAAIFSTFCFLPWGLANAGPPIPICEAAYDHKPAIPVTIIDKNYYDVRAIWARLTAAPSRFGDAKLENDGAVLIVTGDVATIYVSKAGEAGVTQAEHDLLIQHKQCMLNRKLAGFADWQREDVGVGFHL